MVDKEKILELLPHYVAILVIMFLVLSVVRSALGEMRFLVELVIIVVVVSLYRVAVSYLGVAPSSWEQ
jgi:hypothetical protein